MNEPTSQPAEATSAPIASTVARATPLADAWLDRRPRAWLACAVLVAIALLPALHGYYLHTDDYFWSRHAGFTLRETMQFLTMTGRPLSGLGFWLISLWPGGMASMNLLRMVSAINLACLAYMYFRWLRRSQIAPLAALGIAIAAITQPAFQVYGAYLCTAWFGLGFTLAAVAVLVTQDALSVGSTRRRLAQFGLAALAYAASAALYQPDPFLVFALLAAAILATEPAELWRRWSGPALRHAAVFAVGTSLYYVLWREWATITAMPYAGKYDSRALIGFAVLPDRVHWYFHTVLVEIMSFWRMTPSRGIQIAVLAIAGACAIVDFDRRAPVQWLLKYAVIAVFAVASFAPVLVSAAPSTEYRVYGAASAFWVLVVLVGAVRTAARLRVPPRAVAAACLALGLVGVVWAHKTVTEYFAVPDGLEFLRVRQAVRAFHTAHPGAPIRYVHVIPTPTSLIVRQQRNEFGEPCVRAEPNIAPIVRAALSERGLTDRPRITVDRDGHWIEWGNRLHGFMLDSREVAPSDPAETVVVDMRDLVLY